MKYDIPIIASVEAENIDEARQLVYKAVEIVSTSNEDEGVVAAAMRGIELNMADDSNTDNYNNRLVFLHPNDVDSNYDVESYNAKLDKNNEE
jgi:hypothetical protein